MLSNFVEFFIIFIVIALTFSYLKSRSTEITFVKSNVDQKEYLVQNVDNKQEAADLLAKISARLVKFCDYLRKNNDGKHEGVQRLLSRFNPNNISEGTNDSNYSTYTLNKGEKIVYCLRPRNGLTNQLHDINTLMFVSIHELAHIASRTYGHNSEFKENFVYLLKEAIKLQIYRNVNYRENPIYYCNMTLSTNPLFQ